jgi:hypothetical protein
MSCAMCNRKGGMLQRATYQGAPEGGVSVHRECLGVLFRRLEDQQWKADMDTAYRRTRREHGNDRR